jgi:hypothetical protein
MQQPKRQPDKPQPGKRQSGPDKWYEFVRSLRTYYDHFRVAFPDLEQIPKYYSDTWGQQFRASAGRFKRTEDMVVVKKALACAGYGTEKWDRFRSADADALSKAIDDLLGEPSAHVDEQERSEPAPVEESQPVSPSEEDGVPNGVGQGEAGSDEVGMLQVLRAELGEAHWQFIKENPEVVTLAIERHLATPDEASPDLVSREETGDEEAEPGTQTTGPLAERFRDLEAEYEAVKGNLEETKKETHAVRQLLQERDREVKALQDQMRRKAGSGGGDAESGTAAGRKPQAPSEMGAKLKEYEQTLASNEKLIESLKERTATADQEMNELKEALQREKQARHQFEVELGKERDELREQIRRLGDVLEGGIEIPSLEEVEQMEPPELLEYIEDAEKEKQTAIASIEAMDVQEKSYQKQLEVQTEEMEDIQEDLDRYRSSNLAEEMESLRETTNKQRSQLETLLGFSRNLKAQNDHLKERQEPLRKLVDRLNLQEKALVRHVRLNYDREFIPSTVYGG